MKRKLEKFWPHLLLISVTLFFFHKVLFTNQIFVTPGLGLGDFTQGVVPIYDYLAKSLKQGRLPFWAPEISAGFPLVASGEPSPFYPLNLILLYLFPTATALNLYTLFTFLLMGFSTFYFLKSLKLSSEASLLAALSFTFASGIIVRIMHLPNLGTIAYLPLTLLLTQKFFSRQNPLLLIFLGLILSLQILNYNPQTTFICFLGFSLYFLFKVFAQSLNVPRAYLANLLALFFVFLLAFLLSAVQLLPNFELLRLSERRIGVSLVQATKYPFIPSELAYFIRPAPFGDPSLGNYDSPSRPDPSIFWENNAYAGLIALGLGIFALIFLSRQRKEVVFFGFLLIFSLVLALGRFTPFFFILRLPPFSFFRIPGRFVILAMFSLTTLAAFGFEALSQRFASKRTLIFSLLAGIILIDLFSFGLGYNRTYETQKWLSPSKTAQFIKDDPSFFRIYTIGEYEAYYSIYRQFRGWRKDIQPYFNLRESLSPNLGLVWGLYYAESALALPPQRYSQWQNILKENIQLDLQTNKAQISTLALKMLRMKNVKYIISSFQLPNLDFVLKKEVSPAENQPKYFIYELKNPLPHAFIVHQAKTILDSQKVWPELSQEGFDLQKTILLEESFPSLPPGSSPGSDQVEISRYLPEKVEIEVKTKSPSFLILTDTNFPGWEAKIDGQPAKIYQANYLFRAVRLDEGEHQVEFSYHSKSIYVGTIISLSTLFLTLALILFFLIKGRS